jgi:cytochrome c biogenesis protein CcmG/thiol:disulfide interchange protein DsbE
MRRLIWLLPLALFLGLAVLLLLRLGAGDPSVVPSVLIDRPVPVADLPALEGAGVPSIAADSYRGNVTIVNVWASWCAPCRAEHPLIERLAKDKRLRVAGINYKDKPEAALRFLKQLGNPFAAISADATGRAAIDWGVYGVPETFVVGKDGRIKYKQVGPLTAENFPRLMAAVEKALREKD